MAKLPVPLLIRMNTKLKSSTKTLKVKRLMTRSSWTCSTATMFWLHHIRLSTLKLPFTTWCTFQWTVTNNSSKLVKLTHKLSLTNLDYHWKWRHSSEWRHFLYFHLMGPFRSVNPKRTFNAVIIHNKKPTIELVARLWASQVSDFVSDNTIKCC